MGKKSKTACGKFKGLDMYGDGIGFNFSGEDTYKTYRGLVVTILTLLMLILYSIRRVYTWIDRGDSVLRSNVRYGKLDLDRQFTNEDFEMDWVFLIQSKGISNEIILDQFDF